MSVSQAKSHLFTFTKHLLEYLLVLADSFSTPLINTKGSSTLSTSHSTDYLLGTANVLMASIPTYACEFYILPTSLSELQIAFHASSPASPPEHQVLQHPPQWWAPALHIEAASPWVPSLLTCGTPLITLKHRKDTNSERSGILSPVHCSIHST